MVLTTRRVWLFRKKPTPIPPETVPARLPGRVDRYYMTQCRGTWWRIVNGELATCHREAGHSRRVPHQAWYDDGSWSYAYDDAENMCNRTT